MIAAIALLTVCIILPVALIVDSYCPSRTAEAISDWAEDRGYYILQLKLHPRPLGFQFGLCSLAQKLYVVDVVCSAGRVSRFVLKAGGYLWGDRVKKLSAYQAGDLAQA